MLSLFSKVFDFALNTYGTLLVQNTVKSREKKAFLLENESPYFPE